MTSRISIIFFFNDTATTEIYTLSLHDALPISIGATTVTCTRTDAAGNTGSNSFTVTVKSASAQVSDQTTLIQGMTGVSADRKSTRLNSSHANISYAVFCLKKK